jgi:aminoglycoside phosphotransferase (APT) family kinase protein
MNRLTHLLLSVSNDIGSRLSPELSSGEAREAAAFLQQLLLRLAGEAGPFDEAAVTVLPRYKELILSSIIELERRGEPCAPQRRAEATSNSSADRSPIQQLQTARALLAKMVAELSPFGGQSLAPKHVSGTLLILQKIAALEDVWRESCRSGLSTAREAPMNTVATTAIHDRVNPDTVSRYLRQQFTSSPEITAVEVTVLPGGRSKKTLFISLEGTDELPSTIVMRQDAPLSFIKTTVADEAPVLRAVWPTGLPVPRVYHYESETTELGPPFLLLERLAGKTIGDYFGFSESRPRVVLELARILARLHAIAPASIPLHDVDLSVSPGVRMRGHVEQAWNNWRKVAEEPSPTIESAFAWMYQVCERVVTGCALVHGDAAPHNILVDGDRVSGLLDWEFTSVGDPAEDLAYIRSSVERVVPWHTFMQEYTSAGGLEVSEERLKFFRCWSEARNSIFVINGMRAFREGSADCSQGMISFFVLPLFEDRLTKRLIDALTETRT